jgi:sulfoacetaldehyde acetyltransferase
MKYTAGEAIVRSLEIEGISHVFGILGSNILDVFDLVGRSPKMKFVGTRHEEHAAQMAHGFARAGGTMAMCLVQSGSGTANLASGFATALRMHAPMLGMSGGPGSAIVDDNGRHEVDQVAMMSTVTKWSARVPSAERVPEFMQRAFRIANTAPRGPVFLEIPSDVLKGSFEWDPPASKTTYRAKFEAMVDAAAIEEAATLIASAQRPFFIVGQGGEDEDAWQHLAAISEGSQIPLSHTFGHNSAIPHTTPLAVGGIGRRGSKAAMHLLSESDLVVIVGSRLQRYTTIPYYGFSYWPAKARVILVNPDPLTVGRHIKVDLGIACEARAFLRALRERLATQSPVDRGAWRSRIVAAKAEWEVERWKSAEPATFKDGRYLNPAAVYAAVGKALPDAIYLNEVGSTTQWGFCMINYSSPKGFIYTGSLAGLGFPMPGALGAKLARPDREVVAMLGDGAFSLSLQALVTAVEHKIPVRYIVCDNAAWGAEKGHQMHWFDKHYVGGDLVTGDLVGIATAIGAKAVRVQTLDALLREIREQPTDRPKVIVCPADPEDFPEPVPHSGLPARSWKKGAGG